MSASAGVLDTKPVFEVFDMQTLKKLMTGIKEIPAAVAWYLADNSEAKGKQELNANQSPQKLKMLREHALIESAVSSNRIEGVEVEKKRIGTVIFGSQCPKDRNEEEVQGYRNALQWIHKNANNIPFSVDTIKQLHRMTRGEIWDAGKLKDKDSDIVERLPDGNTVLRFKTVSAASTPTELKKFVSASSDLLKDNRIHPLIVIAACNFDFLCIHPFRDGNGRVSRLLLLLQLYHAGYEVGRYISLERLIEDHKERYYETLKQSSDGWHQGTNDPWPYIMFLLYILKKAYSEFSDRLKTARIPGGTKTDYVRNVIRGFGAEFTFSQLKDKCPGVSRDMVRKVMKDMKREGLIVSEGRGPAARWKNKGNTP
jgi:Fic family protein